MLRRRISLALCALVLLIPAGAAAKPRPAKQAAGASVWATVNLCDTREHPGAIGVRVEIPDGVDSPEQWAHFRLQWFDGAARAWRHLDGADSAWTRVGVGARPVQGGMTFGFDPPAAGSRVVLRAVVDVQWRKAGKTVDALTVRTTAGHENRADRHLRVSRASCEIARD